MLEHSLRPNGQWVADGLDRAFMYVKGSCTCIVDLLHENVAISSNDFRKWNDLQPLCDVLVYLNHTGQKLMINEIKICSQRQLINII